jgi:hypothetical protein
VPGTRHPGTSPRPGAASGPGREEYLAAFLSHEGQQFRVAGFPCRPGRTFDSDRYEIDSADSGQDIVLAEGHAELAADAAQLHLLAGKFPDKYGQALGSMSFEQWRSTFSQPLLIHVERIIAWTRTAAGLAYRTVP